MAPRKRFTLLGQPDDLLRAHFLRDVTLGLSASPKRLPCRYFYDRLGSLLFEAICALPEYYLTRAEEEILRLQATAIAAHFSDPVDLIELGSGSAAKTRLLIEAFLARFGRLRYMPLDISSTALQESAQALLQSYPELEIAAIAGEYQEGLEHLRQPRAEGKLILWLGSNIGNLERADAARFLSGLRQAMTPGDRLLVGIDLRKDRAVLEAAYDDPCGVTAAFNRNILARVNRELGGNLDVAAFQHRAIYNHDQGRVEMYLESTRVQRVRLAAADFDVSFAAQEAIHTENSYKYSSDEIDTLAAAAGLRRHRHWLDSQRRFSLNLLASA